MLKRVIKKLVAAHQAKQLAERRKAEFEKCKKYSEELQREL